MRHARTGFLLAMLLGTTAVARADVTIPQLSAAQAPSAGDLLDVWQSGHDVQMTLAQLSTYMSTQFQGSLTAVARTGSYTDLLNRPVIGTDLLAPGGNGSHLTGITAAQVGALPLTGGILSGALQAPQLIDGGLTPGQCVQAGVGGQLISTGAACGTGGGTAGGGYVGTGQVGQLAYYAAAGNALAPLGLSGLTITNGYLVPAFGTTAGTVAQGNDARIAAAMLGTNNLGDVANVVAARTNLGVGPARSIPNVAALATIVTYAYPVQTEGYYTIGDGGDATYDESIPACDLNSGAGDDGSEFPSARGGCWHARFTKRVSLKAFGCVQDSNNVSGGGTDNSRAMPHSGTDCADNATAWASAGGQGNRTLYVPGGNTTFRFTKYIGGVGTFKIEGDTCQDTSGLGSTFFFDHVDQGFYIAGKISFDHVCTYRAQPGGTASASWQPANAGYDINMVSGDLFLHEVQVIDATQAVHLQQGRVIIDGLRGEWLQTGIQIDQSYDTDTIMHVRSWPYWNQDLGVYTYMRNHRTDLVFNRVDNPEVVDFFGILGNSCLSFGNVGYGITSRANIVNFGCDGVWGNAVQFIGASGATATFTNGYSYNDSNNVGVSVYVDANSQQVSAQFGNWRSSGSTQSPITVLGAYDRLDFTGLFIDGFGFNQPSTNMIPAISSVRTSYVFVNDDYFNISGNPNASAPIFGGPEYAIPSGSVVTLPGGSGELTLYDPVTKSTARYMLGGGYVALVDNPMPNSPFAAVNPGDTTQNCAIRTPAGKLGVCFATDQYAGYVVTNLTSNNPAYISYKFKRFDPND